MSIGVANPRPSAPTSLTAMAVVTPTTAPELSSSAPPDEPGAIGASVWIMSSNDGPVRLSTWRPRALMTPTDTDGPPASPSGDPTAMATAPTLSPSADPSGAVANWLPSTLTTATSVSASAPTTRAGNSLPSAMITLIDRASCTTWLLVRISPSLRIITP